ncbi:hypothetical protein CU097_009835 [Rhizopus azygosporus]|uniref:DUF202 domain-containing protein n=1 Tax=Rhizopus azygosporus TaxID=86630 RepID=A0A367JD54_RHIAZ|nr:hypothetical protein CU097_009835 [Rhizopus azygosporus]
MSNEAGPSTITIPEQADLAPKSQIFETNLIEDIFDYSILTSNDVSMARDMLANERNWLTWLRLSCTLIILGFTVLLRLRLPDPSEEAINNHPTRPIGYVFIAVGLGCLFVGVGKYFKNQRLLIKQATFVQAGWGSFVMVGILAIFTCTIMIIASTS